MEIIQIKKGIIMTPKNNCNCNDSSNCNKFNSNYCYKQENKCCNQECKHDHHTKCGEDHCNTCKEDCCYKQENKCCNPEYKHDHYTKCGEDHCNTCKEDCCYKQENKCCNQECKHDHYTKCGEDHCNKCGEDHCNKCKEDCCPNPSSNCDSYQPSAEFVSCKNQFINKKRIVFADFPIEVVSANNCICLANNDTIRLNRGRYCISYYTTIINKVDDGTYDCFSAVLCVNDSPLEYTRSNIRLDDPNAEYVGFLTKTNLIDIDCTSTLQLGVQIHLNNLPNPVQYVLRNVAVVVQKIG